MHRTKNNTRPESPRLFIPVIRGGIQPPSGDFKGKTGPWANAGAGPIALVMCPCQKLVKISCRPMRIIQSTSEKNTAVSAAMIKTMIVVITTSRRVGQTILATSARTC